MIFRFALCASIVIAVAGSGVNAQEKTVKIAGLEVSADCALAKGEHPRLLFRGRDLPKYKARIAGPMKEDFERFKDWWDRKVAEPDYKLTSAESADGICLGVLYQLTGDERYARIVRESPFFKKGSKFWTHAFAMDLIFDTLSEDEIREQAEIFLKNADANYRWSRGWSAWTPIVLWGAKTGHDEELAAWLERGYRGIKQRIAETNEMARNRGGDENSFSYIGNHTVISFPAMLVTLTNALGEDGWGQSLWARTICAYYVYHFMPWMNAAIHFDNTTGLQFGTTSGDFCGSMLLAAAPARYRDGLYQWWIRRMLHRTDPTLKGWPKAASESRVMHGMWGRILFVDPTLPELPPGDFPPTRFFRWRGIASMRENWTPDATFVHFRCGEFGGLGDLRHNADLNTFTIYRKGILALDTGGEHSLDAGRLKLKPGGDDHCRNYSSETIAHNSVLIYHAVDDPLWKDYGKLNTGGQILRRFPSQWKDLRGYRNEKDFPGGIPLAWETSPEYDYVAGDASNRYSPATCKSFVRQLVYVRPNLVFVFDRVETARDGCRTTWLLHTADRPTIDGNEQPDKRIHQTNHFLLTGSTLTVTDEQMGGRMFCRMLLPEKREVRLLGGKFHDFELPDGRNIGPTEATYESGGLGLSRALGEGVAGWRIEVEDQGEARSVRFLNVFETCDKDQAKMVPCELVRRGDAVGAKVTLADGTVEVLFNDTGDVGGHVSIKRADAAVDSDLATKIEDNYDRWKNHPDYQKWMTYPQRRSVILGEDP